MTLTSGTNPLFFTITVNLSNEDKIMNDEIDSPPPVPQAFIIKRLLSENFNTPHLLTDIDISQLMGDPAIPSVLPIVDGDGVEIMPEPSESSLAIPNVNFAYNKDYQIIYMIPKDTSEPAIGGVSYLYLPPLTEAPLPPQA